MRFYQTSNLVATLTLSLLLFSTNSFSYDLGLSEWIFQVRSESGFLLSPGLLSLKKNNAGQDFLFSACDFLQTTGAITTLTDQGCVLTTLDDRKLYVNKKGGFDGKKKIFSVLYKDETSYISINDLALLGYTINIESSEMVISVSHTAGLPIDKQNELLSETVVGKPKEIKLKSEREYFSFNRFQAEAYTSPSRKGSLVEGDFDFATGEFIFKQCDVICLSFINWNKRFKKKGHTIGIYAGNYDLFFFPGKWKRLSSALVVEVNKKSTRQKYSLDYGATTDYFIYRNGILIRRGKGSLKDIEIDLSEENYFSQYTVRVIDGNGRIQTFDLYNGLGLLDSGDYSMTGGYDSTKYSFANGQFGVTKNFNVLAGAVDARDKKYFVKRAKTSFKNLRFEYGELTNEFNIKENSFEQGEVNFSSFAYIYNHRVDQLEARDNVQHTALYTPNSGLIQVQHRILDKAFYENEFLLGKQINSYFVYGKYIKFSDHRERQGLNISSSQNIFNYDVGIYSPWRTPGYFALISGSKKRWRFTANVDAKPKLLTFLSRVDYTLKNKNIYSTIKHTDGGGEIGIGLVYSFFPVHYDLDLKKQAQSIVMMKVFLDLNENGVKDPEDIPLNGIGGFVISKNNYKMTDASGKMYFEVDSNYNSIVFSFDESSFKEMYYLPPKENLKLELAPRKVNSFDVPVKINGVILLECTPEAPIKNLVVFRDKEKVHSVSTCNSPTVLDHMKPGKYKIKHGKRNAKKSNEFMLQRENNYFADLAF